MKKHEPEKPIPCCHHDVILFCCQHPDIHLTWKDPDAAREKTLYAPDADETGGYAENTAAWD